MDAVRTGRRSIARTLAIAAGSSAALLMLTGCLSVTANVAINSDAKGTGTFAISLQKQAAKLMGMNDLESFKSGIKQDSTTGAGSTIANAKCEPSETSDSFVLTCSFTDAEFVKPDELYTITKSNNQIVFQMKNAPTAGADAGQVTDLLGGGSIGDVTVNVTFPGPIQSISGKGATQTSDTTATIKGAMTDTYDVTITSATSSGLPIGLIIAVVVGLLLVAAIVIALIVFLVRRGKRHDAPTALPAGEPTAPSMPMPPASGEAIPMAGAAVATSAVVASEPVMEAPTEVVDTVTETVSETATPEPPEPPAAPTSDA
jgi:hypothetical protein